MLWRFWYTWLWLSCPESIRHPPPSFWFLCTPVSFMLCSVNFSWRTKLRNAFASWSNITTSSNPCSGLILSSTALCDSFKISGCNTVDFNMWHVPWDRGWKSRISKWRYHAVRASYTSIGRVSRRSRIWSTYEKVKSDWISFSPFFVCRVLEFLAPHLMATHWLTRWPSSYVNDLSIKKQDKALIHAKRARNIKTVLMDPKDTAVESAQFRCDVILVHSFVVH